MSVRVAPAGSGARLPAQACAVPGATILAVFAKPPRPGLAKTRLSARLGSHGAASLAAAFLRDVWATARGWPRARVVLAGTSEHAADYGLEGAVEVWSQGEGDLGARMERIARRALASADLAILVGADLPTLGRARLEAARAAAADHDAVLGPTPDGGYDLLALRRCPEGLLYGLPWSCRKTLSATAARLVEAGMSLARLAPGFDVDEPADLDRLLREIAAGRAAPPATTAALVRLGLLPGPAARPGG